MIAGLIPQNMMPGADDLHSTARQHVRADRTEDLARYEALLSAVLQVVCRLRARYGGARRCNRRRSSWQRSPRTACSRNPQLSYLTEQTTPCRA
ncbi:hypothetical protein ACIOG4_28460 [Streptomyces microflavus]|uniref:hypothetical protein n=1 Tax=Streptomyces microflavus TaxID=1919 RepID=UPI0038215039